MPLSKGHILVTTREHYEKVGELGVRIGEEVCFLSFFPIAVDCFTKG